MVKSETNTHHNPISDTVINVTSAQQLMALKCPKQMPDECEQDRVHKNALFFDSSLVKALRQ